MWTGTLLGIFLAPSPKAPMVAVTEVAAIPGRGLEGDRYFHGTGTFQVSSMHSSNPNSAWFNAG
jgi:hypothetical protein